MNKNQLVLSERREYLVNRAAQQRLALKREMEPWQVPLALADRSITALRYVRRHPQWIVGIVILLTVARPAGVWRWLERGLITWQVAKTLGAGNRRTGSVEDDVNKDLATEIALDVGGVTEVDTSMGGVTMIGSADTAVAGELAKYIRGVHSVESKSLLI